MIAGCTAGGLAAAIATPTELLKVRAQGYPTKPPPFLQVYNIQYTTVVVSYYSIISSLKKLEEVRFK